MDIYLYYLIKGSAVKYVGLTTNPKKRQREHKRKFSEHEFLIQQKFSSLEEATISEVEHIKKHNTYEDFSCWNKSPGGDYGINSGYDRKGIGGYFKPGNIPWNKGLDSSDERVKTIAEKSSITKRKNGSYIDCGKRLPKLIGDKNHMKKPEHRKRMSELASRRYRVYKEDGSWTWGYHPPN